MWCLFSDVFHYVGMTTRFNKARYAELKQKEGEEAQPRGSLQSKRRRLKKGGDLEKPPIPFVVHKVFEVLPSSPTVSVEEVTPSLRPFKGRDKGKSVSDFWNDLGLVVARAHDVISTNELGHFSSIESHDLITQHFQKNVPSSILRTTSFLFILIFSLFYFYFYFYYIIYIYIYIYF